MDTEIKPSTEQEPLFESRFGDVNKILEIMREGEVLELGKIDELYPETVPPHKNEVEVVDLSRPNANEVLGIKIQKGQDVIRCVFKPADGENKQSLKDFSMKNFYPRECAAFMVSRHFGFDVVPPTIIREINGRVGALQLFLDHEYYRPFSKTRDLSIVGEDFKKIALLDWILANCERHIDNFLVKLANPQELVAIDHGIILSGDNYFQLAIRGPSLALTRDNLADKPLKEEIPAELIQVLENGFQKRANLNGELANFSDLDPAEIDSMWERVKYLIDTGVFLSKENFRAVVGHSYNWLKE